MPMPIDLYVMYQDGSEEIFHIPLQMARAEKKNPFPAMKWNIQPDWAWAYPTYALEITSGKKIKALQIDATQRMADINLDNNMWEAK